jgi:ribosomal small subunit protein bTHX
MGKGDRKTQKGKILRSSHGKTRLKKKAKGKKQ